MPSEGCARSPWQQRALFCRLVVIHITSLCHVLLMYIHVWLPAGSLCETAVAPLWSLLMVAVNAHIQGTPLVSQGCSKQLPAKLAYRKHLNLAFM